MLEVLSISKKYKEKLVFEKISLTIDRGKILLIKGESGLGKSTLLNILALLEKPSIGEVVYDGFDTSKFNDLEMSNFRISNIGVMFQEYNLLNDFTVYENLVIASLLSGKKISKIDCLALLIKYNLKVTLDQKVSKLSGGESQRLGFIRCIINSPKYIFLDEPTSNLDEKNKNFINEMILESRKSGIGIVIVSHDNVFDKIADEIYYLKQ